MALAKKVKRDKKFLSLEESSSFDRGVVFILFATLVLISLAYSPYTYYYDGIKYYLFVGGGALLGVWVSLKLIYRRELTILLWKDDLPILALLFFSLLSLVKTNDLMVSLRQGVFFFLYIFIFYVWRGELRRREELFSKLETLIAILGFLVGGYIILQYYGIYIWIGKGDGSPPTLYSTMGHQNFAAGYAATAFPFLLLKYLKAKGKFKWIWASFTIAQSLGIYLTQSREGFAAWGMAIIALLWFSWRGGLFQVAFDLKRRVGAIVSLSPLFYSSYTTFPLR